MEYKIKRYDVYGTCYGETIFRGSKRLCLEYLKNMFSLNGKSIKNITREHNCWTVEKQKNIFHYVLSEEA